MREDIQWMSTNGNERLEALRREAALCRLGRAGGRCPAPPNLWARMLPPLRRLEGWLERHAASEKPGRQRAR